MIYKVKFSHSAISHPSQKKAFYRLGKEVYRHPKGYFIVLEFQGKGGTFRECFRPNEIKEWIR